MMTAQNMHPDIFGQAAGSGRTPDLAVLEEKARQAWFDLRMRLLEMGRDIPRYRSQWDQHWLTIKSPEGELRYEIVVRSSDSEVHYGAIAKLIAVFVNEDRGPNSQAAYRAYSTAVGQAMDPGKESTQPTWTMLNLICDALSMTREHRDELEALWRKARDARRALQRAARAMKRRQA